MPTDKIWLTETGKLFTGKNEFPVSMEGYDQLAHVADIPRPFFKKLDPDFQAIVFNHCFLKSAVVTKFGRNIRLDLDENQRVIGFDDPRLLRITSTRVIEAVCASLPQRLSPEEIEVQRPKLTPRYIHFSCFSPKIIEEPRRGDIINGGIDVVHNLTGDSGTQVLCYVRRLACTNGATAHVCRESKQLRARRLPNGQFDETDMLQQICRVLTETWAQLDEKLAAVKGLLNKDRIPIDLIRQQRTKFSLNDRMIKAIESALHKDEIGPTNTLYDMFNALSRVATHDVLLNSRQQRTLSRMAGELSQQTAHKCDKCGQWVVGYN